MAMTTNSAICSSSIGAPAERAVRGVSPAWQRFASSDCAPGASAVAAGCADWNGGDTSKASIDGSGQGCGGGGGGDRIRGSAITPEQRQRAAAKQRSGLAAQKGFRVSNGSGDYDDDDDDADGGRGEEEIKGTAAAAERCIQGCGHIDVII